MLSNGENSGYKLLISSHKPSGSVYFKEMSTSSINPTDWAIFHHL